MVGAGDLRLRPATSADVRAIAELQTTAWREAYAGLVPAAYLRRVGVAERETRWAARIVGGTRSVTLAERSRHLVGVVSTAPGTCPGLPALELASLYVRATQQGSGIGARLLAHALGEREAYLWVFAANLGARRFYARHGFAVSGDVAVDPDTGVLQECWIRLNDRSPRR